MSVNINADTTNGLVMTSDTSGEIKLQSAGADIATVNSSGITMASGKTLPAEALSGTLPALNSSGIYLGGTTSANLLDDYEYGAFDPNLSEGGNSLTVNSQSGRYVKVGKMVFADFQVGNITRSGTGHLKVDLPFVVDGYATGIAQWNRITYAASYKYITLHALNNSSTAGFYFVEEGNTNVDQVLATSIADGLNADFVVSLVYKTD